MNPLPHLMGQSRRLRRAWSSVLDFCFPALCGYCEEREVSGESGALFCGRCQQTCDGLAGRQCQRCSALVGPYVDNAQPCVHCRDERFAFEAVCSLGPYSDTLRAACLRAKTAAGHSITIGLAQQLASLRRSQFEAWQPDLVIPVPHHWWEQVRRVHLSPAILAETLAAALGIPARFDLLRKIKRTEKQALLPFTKRRANLKGAFGIGGQATLAGATVLLVDDILTTGTTADECSRTLQQAGAGRVHVAVFARAAGL